MVIFSGAASLLSSVPWIVEALTISRCVASAPEASASDAAAAPANASKRRVIRISSAFLWSWERKPSHNRLRADTDQAAERPPAAVVIAEHPHLLERQVVGRGGLDGDARLQE